MSAVEGWTSTTVEHCCEVLDSKRIPINAEDREKRIGEIPYYGANGLQGYIDDFIFDEPLILIAEDGGCFDEFATRPIAYRIKGKSWVNNHAHVLRAKEEFDQDAVFYNLEHKDIQSFIVGGTRSKLNQSALRSITLTLPTSKLEQSKIAEILSTVDHAIEQTEALIAKQQRIKTGLMQGLLKRGIDEHGNLRSEETHKFKDSSLGRIPVDWEVKPLSAIIEIIDCKHYTPAYIEDGIPIIRPRNIKDSGFDLSDLDYVTEKDYAMLTEKHEPTDGDIIFSRNASFGIPVYVEGMGRFCIGQDVVVMRKKTVDTRFVFFSLKSDKVVRQIMNVSGGSTFGRIDLGDIRELKIPVPKDECEQHEIAVRLLKCDKAIEIAAHNLMKLRSLKTGLMQDLLTGKKRVTALLTDKEKVNL
ncbi:MAG TPA: hypothetical protein HA261_08550 [Methanosarcina sp.]|nr:hypothetical protein [Methanosarcina sp.]